MTCLKLLVLMSFAVPLAEESVPLTPVREKLEHSALRWSNFSVELLNRVSTDFRGPRQFEIRETHFYGKQNQFRRDLDAGTGMGARRNPGNMIPQILFRTDLLTLPGFLEQAEVVGQSQIESLSALEIRCRPKIEGVKVEDARLWVHPETGAPLRLKLRFSAGRMMSAATLTREMVWDAEQELSLPSSQLVELSFGGFRGGGFDSGGPGMGGGQIRISTEWSDYEWGLEFDSAFFEVSEEPQPGPRRRAGARPEAEENPFEEIQIVSPLENRIGMNHVSEDQTDEILIQGGSVVGNMGPRMSESEIMSRVLGGGYGGRGGRGGGIRGMRIGGSRANRLQGSVNTGFSSSALDAKPYSLDGEETADPDYFSWNAGLAVGGPLSSAQSQSGGGFQRGRRSSFFVDFNVSRGDTLQSQYARVPTALERAGDFSQTSYDSGALAGTPVRLFDPLSGSEIPDAVLPELNPTSVAMLDFAPMPNRGDSVLNYFSQQSLENSSNRFNVRLMFGLTEALRLMGSYNLNDTQSERFNIFPGFLGDNRGRGHNLSLSLNYTLGPGSINDFRARWNRNSSLRANPFVFERDISSEFGIQNTSPAPIDYGLPANQFTNFTSLDDGGSSKTVRERNIVSDSLMLVRGDHFFRFGGEVGWNRWNLLGSPNGSGTLTFAGVATSLYVEGRALPGTGYDLADFLLGQAQSSRIQYGNSDHYLRRPEFAFFANDNWRVSSRVTLQWGLRYQFIAPWVERYDRLANLDLAPGFTAAETVIPGSVGTYHGTFSRALVENDWNNLAPRVAVAYRLNSGKWASVLRSSYGVFFPNETYDYFASELTAQPPFGFSLQTTSKGLDFLDIQSAFDLDLAEDVPNTYAVEPTFRLATVQNWDFSIQQSLPRSLFLSLGYVGSRGTGLEQLRAPNRLVDGQPQTEGTAEYLYLSPGGSSTYHGLQVMAMRRVRSGFTLNGTYEFGKSLDNASTLSGGQRIVAQNDQDLAAEKGRSSFNELHRFRLNWFLELPFGDRHRWFRDVGVWNSLLSNWFLNGTFTANSGRPVTARVLGNQIDNSGTSAQASERASVTGEPASLPSVLRDSNEWFNTRAFRLPVPGVFGDAGRNTIDGPGAWTINLSLSRSIPLNDEGRRLLFTLQTSNLFNHPNFTGLDSVVNSKAFGRVTSVGAMRRIQLSFRFMF